jgi:hypothetical protein
LSLPFAARHNCFRSIQIAVVALELGFEFHFEGRKIDNIPTREFPGTAMLVAGSCSNPTTKWTASSRTLLVAIFGSMPAKNVAIGLSIRRFN